VGGSNTERYFVNRRVLGVNINWLGRNQMTKRTEIIVSTVFVIFFSFAENILNGTIAPSMLMSIFLSFIFLTKVFLFTSYKFSITYSFIEIRYFSIFSFCFIICSCFNLFSLNSSCIVSYIFITL